MQPTARLIGRPQFDFDTFLSVAHKVTGRNLADGADKRERPDDDRFLFCLAEMNGRLSGSLGRYLTYAFVVVGLVEDIDAICELGGMQYATCDAASRAFKLAVIVGSLAEWRAAINASPDLLRCVDDEFRRHNAGVVPAVPTQPRNDFKKLL